MHESLGIIILLFIAASLLIGAALRQVLKGRRTPYAVALLILGLGIGLAQRFALVGQPDGAFSQTVATVAAIDPHLILFLFLPTLIFESAFAIETHLFRRTFSQIAMLAVPGLVISTVLTAALTRYALPWNWSWTVALMFGALISATDPVAVVALLRETSSRKRLETLIEGESLLNDGTAIVLFTLFYGMLSLQGGATVDAAAVAGDFLRVVSAGTLVGLLLGWVTLWWIGRVFNDPLIEISLSIAVAYLAFYIAEDALHVSGVMALVTLGILFASVGRTRISPEVAGFLHHFWGMMAHIANTLIFLLVGIIIARRVQLDSVQLWLALPVVYVGVMAIRAASVAMLSPLLRRLGIGFGRDKGIMLVWGGLRGAVALALALSVAQSPAIDPAIGNQILFLSAGIVVLTIVINGATFSRLLAWLGLDRLPPAKQATVDRAERVLRRDMETVREAIRARPLLEHADWQLVESIMQRARLPESPADAPPVQAEALSVAYQRRILEAERKFYWRQFDDGILCRQAAATLVAATEEALDGEPRIYPRKHLEALPWWPRLLHWLDHHPRLGRWFERLAEARLRLTYDIARGFLLAQEESRRHLARLAPAKPLREAIDADLERNVAEANARIAQIREQFPQAAVRIETQIAARQLMNQRRLLIEQLAASGMLDATQAERMRARVEREMASLEQGRA